jgi:hypothetical protein
MFEKRQRRPEEMNPTTGTTVQRPTLGKKGKGGRK